MIGAALAARDKALTCAAVAVAMVVGLVIAAEQARAGEWMQVSCVNPNGSAAPSDGWSSFTTGMPEVASNSNTRCTPQVPMTASLSALAPAPVGTAEVMAYQPAAGSTLVGGTVSVSLVADGAGYSASGTAVLYEPAYQYDGSDVFFQCASGLAPCHNATNDYAGDLSLPSGLGGNFYIAAGCGGAAGYRCDSGSRYGAWALVQVRSARFLLSSSAAPQATSFGGSVLQPGVGGRGHLVFTASDATGPGVYAVTVRVDGATVWSGTPNTNGGHCVPVGSDPGSGALMFDWQQPCPPTEVVDVPVRSGGLHDGRHELSVTVTDAAKNTSTVLDQTITTSNPTLTPVPRSRRSVHARFLISWRWRGLRTTVRAISVRRLPRGARVAVRCRGRGCPTLRPRVARAGSVRPLLGALQGRRFHAGDRLLITVTAPRRRPERIEILIRNDKLPSARLL